ncbi:hypothetical protein ABIA14_003032 [Sinorhizobium fredii]
MVEVKPITVFLRSDLAHDPFAGVDAKPGPLDGVVVDYLAAVFSLDHVAFLAVRNLQDFIAERFHSSFARAGVLRTEVLVLHHPFADEAFRWHFFCAADFPEAFTDGEFFEDVLSCLLPPLRFTGH